MHIINQELRKNVEAILDLFEKSRHHFELLPSALTHNDLGPQNILTENDELTTILDFTNITFTPYAQDIALTLYHNIFEYGFNTDIARALVQAYKTTRPLSDEELFFIPSLIKTRIAYAITSFSESVALDGETELESHIHLFSAVLREFEDMGDDDFTHHLSS